MRIDSDPRTNSQMPATALQYRGSGNCAQLNDARGERSELGGKEQADPLARKQASIIPAGRKAHNRNHTAVREPHPEDRRACS
jgi:hypothetical protein